MSECSRLGSPLPENKTGWMEYRARTDRKPTGARTAGKSNSRQERGDGMNRRVIVELKAFLTGFNDPHSLEILLYRS
jgi:predicted NAD-dependent protein-ADP-ribosyltransferase YbiA (DUF1768 family)